MIPLAGREDDQKHKFFDRMAVLDAAYPGGLPKYIENARGHLAKEKPLNEYIPTDPFEESTALSPIDDRFCDCEER